MEKDKEKETKPKAKNSATEKKPVTRKKTEKSSKSTEFIPIDTEIKAKDVSVENKVAIETSKEETKKDNVVKTKQTTEIANTPVEPQKKVGLTKGKKIAIAAVAGLFAAGAVVGGVAILTRDKKVNITYFIEGEKYEITIDETLDLMNTPVSSMPGYSFAGWYLDEEFTQKINNEHSFKKDTVVYPKFVPKTCEVEYFANNGTGESAVQEVVFDTEYNIVENTFTRPNYIFVGWSTDPNAHYTDDGIIRAGQTYTLTAEDMKYYAVWKGEDRTVTFNANFLLVDGQEYTFTDITLPYGEKFTLPTIEGTLSHKTNYEKKFAGYLIGGQVYAAGVEVTIIGNMDVTVNWTDKDSVLYFNLNLPTGETSTNVDPRSFSNTLSQYEYLNLPQAVDTVHYEFKCWNTKPDGTGTDYYADTNFVTTEQMNVLYAVWTGKQRTINVYNQGSLVDSITSKYGDSLDLPVFTLANYTFVGFNDASNFTGNIYNGNISVVFEDEVVNLYAQYTRNQTTITFDANGGTGELAQIEVNTNEAYTFSSEEISAQKTNLTKQYYTLAGWSENPNAEVSDASFSVSVQETEVTLYAIWERKTTQLSFVSDGMETVTVEVNQGEDYTFTSIGFTRDGYELQKFVYNGTDYTVGQTIFVGEEGFEIEVVWAEIEFISFDKTITTVKTTDREKVELSSIGKGDAIYAPNVSVEDSYYDKDGARYYFAGWSTTQGATKPDTFIGETVITATNASQKFYSVYMPADENITYEYDETSGTYTAKVDVQEDITEDDYLFMIPNIYEGKAINKVLMYNLCGTSDIRVVVAEGIETIERAAWDSDSDCVGVLIPSSVKHLKNYVYEDEWYDIEQQGVFEGYSKLRMVTFADGSQLEYIDEYAFSDCTGLTSIEIPSSVTSIGEYAFYGCTGLTSINLSEGLKTIGSAAFEYCTGLTSIEIPSSVTSIGDCAFNGCTGLTSIEIPSSVTSIDRYAFQGCTGLTSIEIPSSVISIGSSAFEDCTGLTSINLSEGLKTIGESAFYGCTGLTSIEIPSSVTSIDYDAFYGCTGLTSINLSEGLKTIGESAFSGCTGLTSIEIPDSVTSIDGDAFYGCTGLTSIEIPDSVTSIGYYAFRGCTGLTSIVVDENNTVYDSRSGCNAIIETATNTLISGCQNTIIPDSVTSIGTSAFYGCTGLTSINLSEGLKTIGESAFSGCTGLTSIEIPSSVTSIDWYAFRECTGLTSIEIPDSVTSIGYYAFYCCTGLTSIEIPDSVTSIGDSAFGYTGLTSIKIPSSVTSIGYSTFGGCTGLTSIEIPSSVTSIDWYAFYGCTGLTSINLSEGLKTIGESAFSGCTGLTSIEIPSSVTSIDWYAFYGCTGLTSIEIPSSVTSIESSAFYGCTGLTSIVVDENNTVYDSRNGCNAIIETATNTLIFGCQNTIIPDSVTSIGTSAFYGCTGLTSIEIPSSVTLIYGYAFSDCTGLTSINLSEGLKTIGYSTFGGCTGLTSIEIPSSVTSIDWYAFYGCTGLTSINLSEGLKTIGESAFSGCTGLTSIEIPSSVTSIGEYAFYGCTGLTSIEIPDSVTYIGDSAFKGCTGLTSIVVDENNTVYDSRNGCNAIIETATNTLIFGCQNTIIPDSVTSIGEYAFYGCTGLTSIEISSSVAYIGDSAFSGCAGLTSIVVDENNTVYDSRNGCNAIIETATNTLIFGCQNTIIPDSVTYIGESAFEGCTGLTSIEIPSSVISIDWYAFSGCTGLTSIEIPFSVTSIGRYAFYGCTGLTSIVVDENNTVYDSRNGCNAIIETETNTLIFGCQNTIIPDGVISIDRYAFYGCTGLTSIEIPSSVTSIGDSAFEGCTGLTSIEFSEGLQYIDAYVFDGCDSLEKIVLPASLIRIYKDQFPAHIEVIFLGEECWQYYDEY